MFARYELLELFDRENLLDEEVGIVNYFMDRDGFTFSLYIVPCEGTVIVTLTYCDFEKPLYDMDLRNIVSIKVERQEPDIVSLVFYGDNKKLLLTMLIRPEISFQATFQ